MKIKFFLLTIFIVFIAASCYQAAGNDAVNGGSLAFKINAPMRAHGAEAGDDGELRIKFFDASDMQEGKDYEPDRYNFPLGSDNAIYYLTKPTPITINGKKTTISYFQNKLAGNISTTPGITEIDRVPAGVSLRAIVEYNDYYAEYAKDYFSNPLYTSYTTHAGVSEPFTVKKGSSATVEIPLVRAAFGTVLFNVPNNVTSTDILVLDPEDFDSKFTIIGNFINRPTPATSYGFNDELQQIDVLPGKKLKLLVKYYMNGLYPAGLSKSFELSPGETQKIDVAWSYTTHS